MANIDELLEQASEIRDANEEKENTALRVGTMLVDILQYIAGFIDRETLKQILQEYASLSGTGLVNWRQSRCVFLATMGTELDNIDGGKWEYTSHDGDIVFVPSSRTLRIAGEVNTYFPAPGVIYVNAHTGHLYKWDVSNQKMTELVDSSSPTVIDYRNAPAFADIPIGATYYFLSQSSGYKIGVKVDANNYCSFAIDPKKVYAFRDARQTAVWNADTQTWTPISGRVINDLTTGGEGDALSAEMGKTLKDLIDLLEAKVDDIEDGGGISAVVSGDTLIISSASSPSVSVGSVGNNSLSCKAGNTATTSFLIQGRRLAGNIAIGVSDPTNWSVSPASISPVGGNVATTQVVVSYNPAAGTAAGTQHQCTVTITCDGVTYGTISMNGTVAAAPSIIITPSTLALSTVENEPKTGTINVKGVALEGDIALAISGSGFSLSSATVAKADAESANGVDVTVTFDGSADGSATITASSTNATNVTAAVTGALVSRKATGETFDVGNLRYTVLNDTSRVSVKSNGATGNVIVPSTVNDENGISYTVKALAYQAFSGSAITSIVLPDTLTSVLVGTGGYDTYSQAFKNCISLASADLGGISVMYQEFFDGCSKLGNVTLRNVTRIYTNAFRSCSKLKKLILPDTIQNLGNAWAASGIEELQIGTTTSCAITNVWFNKMSSLKKVICFKPTPPAITPVYYDLQYGGGFARGFRNYESGRTTDSSSEVFDTNGTGKVYVPTGSVSAYENASGNAKPWSYIKGNSNLAGDSSGRIYEITDDILLS